MSGPHKIGDIIHLVRDHEYPETSPAWGVMMKVAENDRDHTEIDLFIAADGETRPEWPLLAYDEWCVVPEDEIPDDVLIALAKHRLNPTKGE